MHPRITIEDPDQQEVGTMLAEADAWYNAAYPPEHNHLLDVASLKQPGVTFHVARIDGKVVAFGALVSQQGGWGEVKRMYVDPAARGRGLGRMILAALEKEARRVGLDGLRLETGIKQDPAIALYVSAGFHEIAPFAPYTTDPFSRFFEKRLGDRG
ncbi:MAG TPA: GNAT family N-acetyltransferase [Stellaceae bacterium]|nr:GNAT family N-acetyltransferase [Stellaceae bacterium]